MKKNTMLFVAVMLTATMAIWMMAACGMENQVDVVVTDDIGVVPDAGVVADAGIPVDGGKITDAGTATPDAGVVVPFVCPGGNIWVNGRHAGGTCNSYYGRKDDAKKMETITLKSGWNHYNGCSAVECKDTLGRAIPVGAGGIEMCSGIWDGEKPTLWVDRPCLELPDGGSGCDIDNECKVWAADNTFAAPTCTKVGMSAYLSTGTVWVFGGDKTPATTITAASTWYGAADGNTTVWGTQTQEVLSNITVLCKDGCGNLFYAFTNGRNFVCSFGGADYPVRTYP